MSVTSDAIDSLIVVPLRYRVAASDEPGIGSQDGLSMLDAEWEDANGRLPHEPGYTKPR